MNKLIKKKKLEKLRLEIKHINLKIASLKDKLYSLNDKLITINYKTELIKSDLFIGAYVAYEYKDAVYRMNDHTMYGIILNITDSNYCKVKFNNGIVLTVDISQLKLISKKKYMKQISK